MQIEQIISDWNLDENAIVLEPRETFNEGLIGVTEDKCHLVYSYQKLTEALANSYEKEFRNNSPNATAEETPDFLNDACEWVDYNTIRAIPYMKSEYRPIIIYEV